MVKLLIRFHLVPFRPIACRLRRGNPHARLDSSLRWNDGDRGPGCEVPAFAGTTGYFAQTTHVDNVRVGAAMGQWAVVVGLGAGVETERVRPWVLVISVMSEGWQSGRLRRS